MRERVPSGKNSTGIPFASHQRQRSNASSRLRRSPRMTEMSPTSRIAGPNTGRSKSDFFDRYFMFQPSVASQLLT